LAAVLVLGVGFIAGSLAYLWETRKQVVDSVGESRRRAHPARAIHRQSADPIVGVYLKHADRPSLWSGGYTWILTGDQEPESPTFLVVARRPRALGVSLVTGPPLSDLEDYLIASGIGILPVGNYADRVWGRYFSQYAEAVWGNETSLDQHPN